MAEPDSSIPVSLTSAELFSELSRELLRQGKSIRFSAPGRSMYPTIREGEAITVEPIDPAFVRPGDIVLYRSGDHVVAHRVVRREGGPRFILRDDTWGMRDEAVSADQVLGKVVSVERGGRAVNPYSTRAKARRLVHEVASRLKRWV